MERLGLECIGCEKKVALGDEQRNQNDGQYFPMKGNKRQIVSYRDGYRLCRSRTFRHEEKKAAKTHIVSPMKEDLIKN